MKTKIIVHVPEVAENTKVLIESLTPDGTREILHSVDQATPAEGIELFVTPTAHVVIGLLS